MQKFIEITYSLGKPQRGEIIVAQGKTQGYI